MSSEKTPQVNADRTAGGFILLGWSSGCPVVLTLFVDPSVFSLGLYDIVEPYLRSRVLYDPPFTGLGYPPPEVDVIYDPFNDPECTSPDQLFDKFQQWAASYLKHSDIAAGSPSEMSFEKFTPKRTISRWPEEEKAKYCQKFGAIRAIFSTHMTGSGSTSPMTVTLRVQTHKALFDTYLVASYFPNVNVLHIIKEETTYYCMWVYGIVPHVQRCCGAREPCPSNSVQARARGQSFRGL
ncbi:hypothetical protein FB451DRAFT_1035468 [Mycena latifolia]|nr:hypothetical protein FB451DRAFT_1035468 [Mycena latifolia]